jgi:SNF2 family DNA or RNA helicase
MKIKPYKHQNEGFEFSKHKDIFALFAEQGTGKTKMIIMKTDYLNTLHAIDKVLIVCPLAVKDVWLEQLQEHAEFEYKTFVYEDRINTTKKGLLEYTNFTQSPGLKILIIHYEAFLSAKINKNILMFVKSGALELFTVLDESTKIKNMQAKRTKKIIKGFSNRRYKAILTGTPTPNSPVDIYSQFEFLKPGFFGMSLFHFKHHYCIMVNIKSQDGRHANILLTEKYFSIIKSQINKILETPGISENEIILKFEEMSYRYGISLKDIFYIRNQNHFSPFKNLDELNSKISKITFKVMKKDCLDLPEKIYEKLIVEMSTEQKRIIAELKKEYMSEYAGQQLTVTNILTLIGRLQMITGGNFPYIKNQIEDKICFETKPLKENPKLKALVDDLESINENTKIIIWAVFTAELEIIYKTLCDLNYKSRLYYGETNKKERTEIKNDFMGGKFQILVMNPATGGLGLNFQIATLQYFFSNNYKAEDRLQAEDRSHRIGQTESVVYKDIIIKKSIDEIIYNSIKRKTDVINYFRDKRFETIF